MTSAFYLSHSSFYCFLDYRSKRCPLEILLKFQGWFCCSVINVQIFHIEAMSCIDHCVSIFNLVSLTYERRGWDSNPRALADKRFSRPPRYDHFDTSPQRLLKYYTTCLPVCQELFETFCKFLSFHDVGSFQRVF